MLHNTPVGILAGARKRECMRTAKIGPDLRLRTVLKLNGRPLIQNK